MNLSKYLLIFSLIALTGCGPDTPEATIRKFNKPLGKNGELTSTHLIIHWFGGEGSLGTKPVTLKIPREYLVESPIALDAKRRPQWIRIVFALPDARPWRDLPIT